jgi:hypothetical protein
MGEVTFCAHAKEEMSKDRLDASDFINIVRAGIVQAPDYQNNEWRYRITTNRMCFVVAFESRSRLTVVTAWRVQ